MSKRISSCPSTRTKAYFITYSISQTSTRYHQKSRHPRLRPMLNNLIKSIIPTNQQFPSIETYLYPSEGAHFECPLNPLITLTGFPVSQLTFKARFNPVRV